MKTHLLWVSWESIGVSEWRNNEDDEKKSGGIGSLTWRNKETAKLRRSLILLPPEDQRTPLRTRRTMELHLHSLDSRLQREREKEKEGYVCMKWKQRDARLASWSLWRVKRIDPTVLRIYIAYILAFIPTFF